MQHYKTKNGLSPGRGPNKDKEIGPCLFIHGHQHADTESMVGGTRVIGVHGFRLLELKTGEPGKMSGSLWGR